MSTALRLLIVFPPLIAIGIGLSIVGRLGLQRLANGRYRGSAFSWTAYLGGVVLAVLGIAGMVSVLIWGMVR